MAQVEQDRGEDDAGAAGPYVRGRGCVNRLGHPVLGVQREDLQGAGTRG